MDQVLNFVSSIVKEVDLSLLEPILKEQGVTNISDLEDIDFETDTGNLFTKVQARRLNRLVKSQICAPPTDSTPSTSSQILSPTSATTSTTIAQEPCLSSSATVALRNFKIPFEKFTSVIQSKLSNKQRASSSEIRSMVQTIASELWRIYKYPGKCTTTRVASELAKTYPETFLDTKDDGTPIEGGFLSTEKKLRIRVHNLNREASRQTRLNEDPDDPQESTPKRRRKNCKKDTYGCANFLPLEVPAEESRVSLQEKKLWMQTEFKKTVGERNNQDIKHYMQATYILQRELVADKETVNVIRAEFPFLFEREYLLEHFKTLMGFDLTERALSTADYIQATKDYLIAKVGVGEGNSREPTSTKHLREGLIELRTNAQTPEDEFVHIIIILMRYWKQDQSFFMWNYEDTTSRDEIEANNDAPSNPHIAVLGSQLQNSDCFSVVEGNAIEKPESAYNTILLSFALYYVLAIQYPARLASIMEFIQRLVLNIEGEGSKVQRSKNAPSAYNEKVLSLQGNITQFRRQWRR